MRLRLEGAGFHPDDAASLARLWESGSGKDALVASAVALGYAPVSNLEAVLDGADQRPRRRARHGPEEKHGRSDPIDDRP